MGSDSEDENNENDVRQRKQTKKEKLAAHSAEKSDGKKGGYNWAGLGILILFAIPLVITGVLKITDMIYPEAAKQREVRQRTLAYVTRCYDAANPSKLSEVENLVDKYYLREEKLVSQLRNKYAKYPECH